MQTQLAIRRKVPPVWLWRAGDVALVAVVAAVDLLVWGGDRALWDGRELSLWVVPALTIGFYSLLLARWRRPLSVYALQWTYALAGLLLPGYGPFAGLLVALYAVARKSTRRVALLALIACALPFGVNSYNASVPDGDGNPAATFAVLMVLWGALTLTVWGLGRVTYAAERRAEQEKQEQAAAAVRAERLYLARELHDIVSHSVSAMILQAAGARTLVPHEDEQVRTALTNIENTGVEAMGELHRLLGLLRAANPLDHHDGSIPPVSLQDLDALVRSVRSSGVDVEVVVEGHPDELDRSVSLTAYRVVQEALTNTIKHAGRGASARIHLRWDPDGLTLTIRDRAGFGARGKPELSSGHGLSGLTERVKLVGGSLEAGRIADGFLVQAHLPVLPPASQRCSSMPFTKDAS